MKRVPILGVEIDNIDLAEAVAAIEGIVSRGETGLIITANPEIIMRAGADPEFKACLREARMVTPDGIGVVIAAKLLGTPLKQRVTGIDLVSALFARSQVKPLSFYFVGARPGIAARAGENIRAAYPGVNILGTDHGYFDDDTQIIENIRQAKPDIVLAALGMGKQESWLLDRVLKTGVPVGIGVGGSFDVFAGEAKRAPGWMQKTGLEWFYRLVQEPTRLGRMMSLPRFLLDVMMSKK